MNTFGASEAVRAIASFDGPNAERDIQRWFRTQAWAKLVPHPFEFDLSFLKPDGVGTYTGKQSALLPHEVFHTLYTYGPELFHHLFVGRPGNLLHWWQETYRTNPEFVDNHPVCKETPADYNVPIGVHGDDTGIFDHDKALCVSWNSVAVQHQTIDNRILFGTLSLTKMVPGLTLHEFYRVFVWSLNALSTGKFPYGDHNGKLFDQNYYPDKAANAGKQLAGGFVGAWSEFRGFPIYCNL
jgi:hypothetical protein